MPRPAGGEKAGLIAIASLLIAQLALAFLVIPPWQNPDEPQHLLTARLTLAYGPEFSIIDTYPENERALMASMAEHGWWTHYGVATPVVLPASMQDGPGMVSGTRFGALAGIWMYYRATAEWFRYTGVTDPLAQHYMLRALSVLAALLTVACAWAGTRHLAGDFSAFVVAGLIALHPQFILASITGGPDPLINLAGAVVWWQTAALLAARSVAPAMAVTILRIATIWGVTILAVMSRRIAAALLPICAVVTIGAMATLSAPTARRVVVLVGGVAAVLIGIVVATYTLLPTEAIRIFSQWLPFDPAIPLRNIPRDMAELPRFATGAFRSFWLAAGWMRYWASDSWYMVLAIVSTVAASGLVLFGRRDRPAILVALLFVGVQTAAIVVYHFGVRLGGAQGRYMFPVLPAVMFLLWVGWRAWFSGSHGPRLAAVSLIAVMAMFNISAWMLVIFPAYVTSPRGF